MSQLVEERSRLMGAGFWIRAGAYFIDAIVFWVVNLGAGFILGILLGLIMASVGRQFDIDQQTSQLFGWVSGVILFVFYFAIFESLFGATLGKLILGLRVIRVDGRWCSFGPAFVRGLLRYIDGLFFGIPAAMSMKPPLNQRMGDKLAQTVVVGTENIDPEHAPNSWWFIFAAMVYLIVQTLGLFLVLMFSMR